MPIRILYWNIEKFAQNKIANPNMRKRKKGASIKEAQAAVDRLEYIQDTIGAASPDIIVVVEVQTGYDGRGRLVRSSGATGVMTLLEDLRLNNRRDDWMLVPPLQTGPNEGVGVFYNADRLVFTGPNLWPGGTGGVSSPDAIPNTYGGTFGGAIDTDRTVPDGAAYNVGEDEDTCAACVDFTHAAWAGFLQAGQPIDYGVARAPHMTTFAQIDDDGAVIRNITLFAVHSPANGAYAPAYLSDLANVAEIAAPNGRDDVVVVVGDFNVNLMSAPPDYLERQYYRPLQQRGFRLGLKPAMIPPNPAGGYSGYFTTHIRRGNKAVYWSTNARTTYYPAYGYDGSDRVANLYAIDNVFTRYDNGSQPPVRNNMTVMNGIVGSPYTLHAAPAGAPTGTVQKNIAMAADQFQDPPAIAPRYSIGRKRSFNGWANYGRIRSTSDHLALVIDV